PGLATPGRRRARHVGEPALIDHSTRDRHEVHGVTEPIDAMDLEEADPSGWLDRRGRGHVVERRATQGEAEPEERVQRRLRGDEDDRDPSAGQGQDEPREPAPGPPAWSAGRNEDA